MSFTLLDDPSRATRLADRLRSEESIALDCEAAGFHRYSDRLCLVQLSIPEGDYILDPLAYDVGPVLRELLEDPNVEVLMHGADFDIRLLDRDLDIHVRGLFDTQAAAALLGERSLGLQSLLESELGVRLSKKYQRADWARRPLPADMLEYAANDTRHLHALASRLRARLREKGRLEWAHEEFEELEAVRWEEDEDEDPVTRVKRARDMPPREVTALREALAWRDAVARERDRAPFRVVHDHALVEAIRARPESVEELGAVKGMNGRLAREEGEGLLERLRRVAKLPADQLVPYPDPRGNGSGRPPPEVEDRANELKSVRNSRSAELAIDRGTLLSNAMLLEIARHVPSSLEELRAVPGMKAWQVEALGDELLARLQG
ncbi:MAG: HRDC domain-containing protein [Gemmatimonadota bacterium]|jgi:ribonuclease D